MEEDPLTTVVQLPDFHVEIIAASVAVGVLLILIVLAMKVKRLTFNFFA
jgi:hypothetical protein